MRLIKLVFEGTAEEYLAVREQFAVESSILHQGTAPPTLRADLPSAAAVSAAPLSGAATEPDVVTDTREQVSSDPAREPTNVTGPVISPDTAEQANGASAPTATAADDIRRVLQRAPLPESARRLIGEVAAAREQGVARSDLRHALDLTDGELNGVLGTLGRRINATPDLHFQKGKGTSLALIFDIWNDNGWHYRLKPDARPVLEDEGILT